MRLNRVDFRPHSALPQIATSGHLRRPRRSASLGFHQFGSQRLQFAILALSMPAPPRHPVAASRLGLSSGEPLTFASCVSRSSLRSWPRSLCPSLAYRHCARAAAVTAEQPVPAPGFSSASSPPSPPRPFFELIALRFLRSHIGHLRACPRSLPLPRPRAGLPMLLAHPFLLVAPRCHNSSISLP